VLPSPGLDSIQILPPCFNRFLQWSKADTDPSYSFLVQPLKSADILSLCIYSNPLVRYGKLNNYPFELDVDIRRCIGFLNFMALPGLKKLLDLRA
jgi:hypothetical protein